MSTSPFPTTDFARVTPKFWPGWLTFEPTSSASLMVMTLPAGTVIVTGAGGAFCDTAWPPFGAMRPSGAELFDDAAELLLPGAEFWFWVWLGLLLQATPNIISKLTANTAIRNLIEPPFL